MVESIRIGRLIRRSLALLVVIAVVALVAASAAASAAVSFAPKRDFATGGGAASIAIGDFNGDRKPDLAVANIGTPGGVAVLLGDGLGSFGSPASFSTGGDSPYAVAVGDLNGDGNQDLAVANADSRDVSVLPGTGSGAFGAPVHFAAGESTILAASRTHGDGGRLRVGDLDCNGTQDLAVANDVSGSVSVLMNARPGTARPGCGPPDTTVAARVSASRTQRQAASRIRVKVKVAAQEDLTAKAFGTVRLGKRSYKLGAQTARLTAGQTRTFTLKPSRRKDERVLVKALRLRKRAKATVKVALTDLAANKTTKSVSATLKR